MRQDSAVFESPRQPRRLISVNSKQPCAIANTPVSDILSQPPRLIEVNSGQPCAIDDTPVSDIR